MALWLLTAFARGPRGAPPHPPGCNYWSVTYPTAGDVCLAGERQGPTTSDVEVSAGRARTRRVDSEDGNGRSMAGGGGLRSRER